MSSMSYSRIVLHLQKLSHLQTTFLNILSLPIGPEYGSEGTKNTNRDDKTLQKQ